MWRRCSWLATLQFSLIRNASTLQTSAVLQRQNPGASRLCVAPPSLAVEPPGVGLASSLLRCSVALLFSDGNDDRVIESLNETLVVATEDSSSKESNAIGLYVHIPFCRRRCRYCNFAVVPIGPRTVTEEIDHIHHADQKTRQAFSTLIENYTCAVLRELDWIATQQKNPKKDNGNNGKIVLRSIYFGGGTPSLAPTETLERLLSAIIDPTKSPFTVQKDNCEITIEMDPGTFSKDKLQAIKDMGFNRISLGVQSFDDFILESLGRVHRSNNIYESLAMMQEVYGDDINYSLDLITGLPGQSLANWIETLEKAVNLQPRPVHLSVYDLQIEQGTVFGAWYDRADDERSYARASTFQSTRGEAPIAPIQRQPALRLPSADETAFMYKYTSGYLRSKGFEHYEVSSYARQTDNQLTSSRSQHNQIYWDLDGQWYAVGLGATSFVNGRITERPRTLVDYQRWVDRLVHNSDDDDHDDASDSLVSELDFLMDHVLKRLRTLEGLSLDWILERFGSPYLNAIMKGAELGMDLNLAYIDESNRLRLKDPDGFLFSNSIISSIFVELENVPP